MGCSWCHRPPVVASARGWAEDFTASSVKGIGALEVLAAVGLILPAASVDGGDRLGYGRPTASANAALAVPGSVPRRRPGQSSEEGMNPQQVARAGEMFVAAEIHGRGGDAVPFAGNMPGIDILGSALADTTRISIPVQIKHSA